MFRSEDSFAWVSTITKRSCFQTIVVSSFNFSLLPSSLAPKVVLRERGNTPAPRTPNGLYTFCCLSVLLMAYSAMKILSVLLMCIVYKLFLALVFLCTINFSSGCYAWPSMAIVSMYYLPFFWLGFRSFRPMVLSTHLDPDWFDLPEEFFRPIPGVVSTDIRKP